MEGFHAADNTGKTWVLGLREIQTKAAQDVHDTLLKILGDIDEQSKMARNEASRKILINISFRMSDSSECRTELPQK